MILDGRITISPIGQRVSNGDLDERYLSIGMAIEHVV